MTQRRGLGRGLGALIPGAGVSASRASDQDPELRTRRPAEPEVAEVAEAAAGPRPVDMFFSGDPLPESGESRARRRPGGADLAGAMARAAAERRSAARGSTRRRSADEGSAGDAAPGAGSTAEAAPEADSGTTTARSGSSATSKPAGTRKKAPTKAAPSATTSAGRISTAKTTGTKSSAATKASTGAKSSTGSTSSSRSKTSAGTAAKSAGTAARSTAARKTAVKAAASSPAVSDETVENTGETTSAVSHDVRILEAAPNSPETETRVEPPTAGAETPAADSVETEAPAAEERVEDSPIVDVEKVELVPARPAPETSAEDTAASAATEEDPTSEDPTSEEAASEAPAAAAQHSSADAQDTSSATGHAGLSEGLVKVPGAEFAEIPIHEIRENPRNPRTMFDDDALDELAFSLREVGVLQPVVVRGIPVTDEGESFELVMGERRWRAAQRAGLTSIPAIIRETSDDDLLRDALLENLHRTQLNPLEEAAAYQQLLEDFGCTQDELSSRIGRSRPQISNTLRLMRLPALVQRRLASGALSAGHARALLTLEDPRLMEELAGRIVAEGLSVRAVERLVARGAEPGTRSAPTRRTTYNPRVVDITSRLSNQLEAPVRIDVGKRKGRITLEFTNLDDLERLVERLGIEQEAEEHTGTAD